MSHSPFRQKRYAYDFGDTAGMTPLIKSHTLGHTFMPPPLHAGGLRCPARLWAITINNIFIMAWCPPELRPPPSSHVSHNGNISVIATQHLIATHSRNSVVVVIVVLVFETYQL